MGLSKKKTYKYIKELLSSQIKVVKDLNSFQSILSQENLELDNIEYNHESELIRVYNSVKYEDVYRTKIDDNASEIKKLEKLNSEEDSEVFEEIKELNRRNNYLQRKCDLMKTIYETTYSLARDGLQDTAEEVVYISHVIKSNELKIYRELVSRPVQFEIDKSDYSVEVSLMDIFRLEVDMLPIEKFNMYTEVKETGAYINGDNIDEKLEVILELIQSSFRDIEYYPELKQIVKRKKNLQSTIEDYENIINQIDEDEVMDEDDAIAIDNESSIIDESELYLPLPANDQQKDIAAKLAYGSVAVQGPPGTGKTHTIINIISHMLALGKTILVVSEKADALNVIQQKMPKELQPLVMPMLGGAVETRKLTESAIKNIIAKNDTLNVSVERENTRILKAKKIRLQEMLSKEINSQIESYVRENADLVLYNESKKLSEWISSIDMNVVHLDDCKVSSLSIDHFKLEKLMSYDKSLLKQTVSSYIESSLLLEQSQFGKILSFKDTFNKFSIFELENASINNVALDKDENYDHIYLHWYMNNEEYQIDKQCVDRIDELSRFKTKYLRILSDNEVRVSENISTQDIRQLMQDAGKYHKILCKLKNKNSTEVKINGKLIWDVEDYNEILTKYCEDKDNKDELDKLMSRFSSEHYFNIELNPAKLKHIIKFYENLLYIDYYLKSFNYEFIQSKYNQSDFNITNSAILLYEASQIVKDFSKLNEAVNSQLDEYDELKVMFTKIAKFDIDSSKEYDEFTTLVKERERKFGDSVEILKIKSELDSASPSLYSKLVNGECGSSIIENWKDNYVFSQVNKISRSDHKERIEKLRNEIHQTNVDIVEKLAWLELVQNIGREEKQAMQTWITLINKIGKGTGKRAPMLREQAKGEMDKISHTIPVWVTTRSQVSDLFKYTNDTKFDLVIYDESSQSTISALNVLERGHRKLIVGDDKQISPVSMISHDKVHKIRASYFERNEEIILAHDTTLYDFAVAKYNTVNLKEHFRCLPEIIQFSNNLQYNGSMLPLRTINSKDKLDPVVESVFVDTGYLNYNDENIPEAKAIIKRIKEMISDKRYDGKSIGVISLLGNKQDRLISSLIYSEIGMEKIEKYKIKISNSSAFQGDERDVILLSMVMARKEDADSLRTTALTKQSYYQQYNVAASRAKDKMILFHSVRNSDIANKECVRFKILEFFENFNQKQAKYEIAKTKFDSIFEEEIFIALTNNGYNVIPQYESNGFKIDLVVEAIDGKLAVECDGERYHGREQFEADFRRQAILERAGWEFYRIRGRDYFSNKEKSIKNLLAYLINNGMHPYNPPQENKDNTIHQYDNHQENEDIDLSKEPLDVSFDEDSILKFEEILQQMDELEENT